MKAATVAGVLLALFLAGAGEAVAAPDTDPVVEQSGQQGSRDAALRPVAGVESEFIRVAAPAAQAVMAGYRVPAAVGLAQAILESNWGRSALSTAGKNFYGFKCANAGTPGPIAIGCRPYPTRECTPVCAPVTAYFRVYASMADSFADYGRHLSTSPYYASAFRYLTDPDRFAREVARRYATDPAYADKVIRLMVTWNLYQFGNRVPGPSLSGDGRAELVTVSAGGEAHARYNAGGFAPAPWAPGNVLVANGIVDPARARWTDLDGDGRTDFAAVQPATGEVRAWHNVAGLATMPWGGASVVVGTGFTDPARIRFADLDGDRRAEVISIEPGGTVRAWRNVAGFATMPWGGASVVIATGFDPGATFFADLDADGRSDIVAGSPDATLRAWRNAAGFATMPWGGASVVIATATPSRTAKFGDLDGDGRADLMTVNPTTGEVHAHHNIGYAFTPWTTTTPTLLATRVTNPAALFFT
ncbi:glucosaminidase domain-containing protein [Actinophytocola sp.]|uniref:glucosaminidase domain-containing protein n=1 Tax=Actinophytocola sp. TaxID=1872138 RepID=UPI002D7F745C|nr:glucosaminidase domain-containing protein [Actinophytocola sp.]HET9140296.1 glucosaminidase domain-containing protein [Actinophytocola sp.]